MNALILYDEIVCVRTVSQVLQRAGRNANLGEPWHIQPWRTDIIRFPAAADTALAEAIGTDLIVFAELGIDFSAAWLGEWLQRWVLLREVEDAALLVMNGGDAKGLIVQTASWLSEFAARHGLALIRNDSDANHTSVRRHKLGAPLSPASEFGQRDPIRTKDKHSQPSG